MSGALFEKAVRDIERHTLGGIPGVLAKLVYLASTRDYNTGQYHHEGLARTYTPETAQTALRHCHASVFRSLADEDFEALVEEIRAYLAATQEEPTRVLKAWQALEPYRILVPAECDAQTRDLFISNFSAALAVVRSGLLRHNSPSVPQPL